MTRRPALLSLVAPLLITVLALLARDPGQECYDRLREGMALEQAEAVLARYGYAAAGTLVTDLEPTRYVYSRRGGGRTILLTAGGPGGRVAGKSYLGGETEPLPVRLWRRLTAW